MSERCLPDCVGFRTFHVTVCPQCGCMIGACYPPFQPVRGPCGLAGCLATFRGTCSRPAKVTIHVILAVNLATIPLMMSSAFHVV
eukprot:scaffold161567_cov17-Prasinocladus_malaysianus.AAC.1